MALTPQQKEYFLSCVHELNRAIFFGNVPNYVDQMDSEIRRLEGLSNDYKTEIKKRDIDDYSKVKPFGEKNGSDKKEKTVTTRTGANWRKKGESNT